MKSVFRYLLTQLSLAFSFECAAATVVPEIFDDSPLDKYALIIAVEQYENFDPVQNAIDDGAAIASVLSSRNFRLIRVINNPQSYSIVLFHLKELQLHAKSTGRPAVIIFYFAGHGIQDAQFNYIVPSNAKLNEIDDFDYPVDGAVSIQTVLELLKSLPGGITAVLLDSCRTNGPQSKIPLHEGGMPDTGESILALATKLGKPAQSISSRNPSRSPFSLALEKWLDTSESFTRILELTRDEVKKDTSFKQLPEYSNSTSGASQFYLTDPHPRKTELRKLLIDIVSLEFPTPCLVDYLSRLPATPFINAAIDFFNTQNTAEIVGCPVDVK